jgi:capsid protein
VGEIKVGGDYFSNSAKYQAVRYKPRGWSWIDPSKEVAAYKMAVRSGFMTVGDVIAQTSPDSDVEDTFKRREEELDMAEGMGLVFDTNPAQVNDKGLEQPGPVPADGTAPPPPPPSGSDVVADDADDEDKPDDKKTE